MVVAVARLRAAGIEVGGVGGSADLHPGGSGSSSI